MHKLFAITEFLQILSHFLDCSSLLNCIIVSRSWSEILIPQLWSRFGSLSPLPKSDNRVLSCWERFFEGAPLSIDEKKRMQMLVNKHSQHIRTAVIRSPQALLIYQASCTNLRIIHCEWKQPEASLTDEGIELIKQDIEYFVKQQNSCLRSLYLSGWMISNEIHNMVAFYSIKDFYDLDVSLKEEDYRRLGSILPYVESIHLTVSSLETVTIPLKETHPYLKKFSLVVPSLSYEFLQDILISFPNMKHLIVHAEPQVDLQPEDDRILCGYVDIDVENGSRLEITSGYEGDAEVADMIAVIPNLQYFNYFDMRDKCFVALAQHCPHLKDVNADWEAQVLIASNDYDDVPPPTINLLLTSCPELESINCPDHTIHIQHIMEGSHWVCKRLMFFRCQLVGIPQCEPWNEELYKSLEERLLEMSFEEISILSDNECKALNVLKQRKLCQEAMERQFQTLPQIKERYLFGDYMTHQLLPN